MIKKVKTVRRGWHGLESSSQTSRLTPHPLRRWSRARPCSRNQRRPSGPARQPFSPGPGPGLSRGPGGRNHLPGGDLPLRRVARRPAVTPRGKAPAPRWQNRPALPRPRGHPGPHSPAGAAELPPMSRQPRAGPLGRRRGRGGGAPVGGAASGLCASRQGAGPAHGAGGGGDQCACASRPATFAHGWVTA